MCVTPAEISPCARSQLLATAMSTVRDFIRTPAVAGRARTASQAPRAASRWPAGSAQLAPEPAARLGPAVPAYGSTLGLAYCTDKACLLVPDTVIFAIAALLAPYFKSWWKVLPWALAAAVCLSRVYLGVHFPLDAIAGAGLGMFIGGVLNLVFRVPSSSFSTARANGLR
jgi:PAP2 superfamily